MTQMKLSTVHVVHQTHFTKSDFDFSVGPAVCDRVGVVRPGCCITVLCYIVLCYIVSCYVVLCYVVLCYIVLGPRARVGRYVCP